MSNSLVSNLSVHGLQPLGTMTLAVTMVTMFGSREMWDRHLMCFDIINSHYIYVIMGAMASQITSLTIVYSILYSGADQRKHQSPASLAFVRGIHLLPVNSPHKWSITRKMSPYHDVIMRYWALQSTFQGFSTSLCCKAVWYLLIFFVSCYFTSQTLIASDVALEYKHYHYHKPYIAFQLVGKFCFEWKKMLIYFCNW